MRAFTLSKLDCQLLIYFQTAEAPVSVEMVLNKFQFSSRQSLYQALVRMRDKGILDYAIRRSDGIILYNLKINIVEVA